ncbi:MAG: hypothetical protein D6800_05565 [Candidatus Zixiibacteriota bacterium]|nr:MAG: hypothetical protein D6800_05565 [candidate division Zixibacteria bacterium]
MAKSQTLPESWPFKLIKWYGYAFSATFLLFGGVKIILGILDHTTDNFGLYFYSLIVGLILVMVVVAFRDRRPWAWYGMIVMNALVLVLALLGVSSHVENIVLLILSAVVLGLLFYPPTKAEFFKS